MHCVIFARWVNCCHALRAGFGVHVMRIWKNVGRVITTPLSIRLNLFQNCKAYVNAGFRMSLDPEQHYQVISKPTIVFGGLSAQFVSNTLI